jgi:hypothetical protein
VRKFIVAVFASCFFLTADCQQNYWQQQVNYTIDVSLNDKAHTLDGFERIEYINNSPDTLHLSGFISGPMPTRMIKQLLVISYWKMAELISIFRTRNRRAISTGWTLK